MNLIWEILNPDIELRLRYDSRNPGRWNTVVDVESLEREGVGDWVGVGLGLGLGESVRLV